MSVIKMDRSDVIDTSDMEMMILQVATARPRKAQDMPDDLARIIGRLVMGLPVPRRQLEAWDVAAMRLYRETQMDMAELKARFGAVEVPSNKVVPIGRRPDDDGSR